MPSLIFHTMVYILLFIQQRGKCMMQQCWQNRTCMTASKQTHAFSTTEQAMCIYGDPAYPLRVHLQAPYRYRVLTPQMQAYNHSMSAVRSSVEWLFGDIINYFKFLDFKKKLKIGPIHMAICKLPQGMAKICAIDLKMTGIFHL